MLTKTVSGMMLTLLILSMLTFAFNIQPAKSDYVWTRTIYIRADGSTWPLGAPVSTVDNVTYTLTDNIVGAIPEYSSVIIIERNNIVLDGAGYTLQGTKALVSKGIELNGRSNVTIKNMKITALHTGITLYNSSYSSISGNNITDNNWHGISLGSSSNNNTISGNNITANNQYGITLYNSSYSSISRNNITNNGDGIDLGYSSNNNTISGNNITNNGHGVCLDYSSNNNTISGNNITANNVEGVYLYSSSNNNSLSGNNVTNNGHGIRLDYSSNNNTISGNNVTNNGHGVWFYSSLYNSVSGNNITNNRGYGVYLDSSSNNSVSGNNITANTHEGVYLNYSSNNSVSGNNITNNEYGVYLNYSSNNSVSGNNITANNQEGVYLNYSSYNSVSGNNIANNGDGIYLSGSSYNSIVGNNITANNWAGVRLYYSSNNNTISGNNITANNGHGVYLWDSSNNSVSGNNMTNNEYGVWLYYSFYNSVSGNNITNNYYGVYLYYSSNNKFYHNNFIDNTQQVLIATSGYANVWDDGYPSGGNYWSDYTGVDLYSGPNQDTPGSDGIGDTPYLIEAGNQDRYPLMNPYVPTYLTITVTIGTTDPLPGTYTYVKGTVVSVTAIPGINCRFEYWILDGINVGAHNPIEVLMDSSHVLQAVFAQITHQLTMTSTERGATDPSSGTYTYVNGTVANVTAIPQAGYSFDYWLLDGEVRTENPISILMDMNHTLEAFFTDNLPPEIGEPVQEPSEDVEPFQNVTITVNVTDVGTGVCNVTLWYSIDNGTTWMPFNMTEISVNTYQAMIPGRENCTWVTYKIIAYDNSGNSAVNDNHGYYYKYHVIPEFPLALILPLLMLTTLVATVLLKRKRKTKPQLP